MTRDGQITMVAGYTGTEQPPSTGVLQILYEGLRAQVEVEHREGIALKVFLPYRVKRRGQLETGPMSGEAGERRIWPH